METIIEMIKVVTEGILEVDLGIISEEEEVEVVMIGIMLMEVMVIITQTTTMGSEMKL